MRALKPFTRSNGKSAKGEHSPTSSGAVQWMILCFIIIGCSFVHYSVMNPQAVSLVGNPPPPPPMSPFANYKRILIQENVAVQDVVITQPQHLASSRSVTSTSSSNSGDRSQETSVGDPATLFANGVSFRAADDIEQDSTVFTIPTDWQFRPDAAFTAQLQETAKKGRMSSFLREPDFEIFQSVLFLLQEAEKAGKTGMQAASKFYRSPWKWWIRMLPPRPVSGNRVGTAINHGLFMSPADFDCLNERGKTIVKRMQQKVDTVHDATVQFCNILTAESNAKSSLFVKYSSTLQEVACATTKEQVAWAFAILSARQFDVEGMPTVFPVVDAMPYAVNAALVRGGKHVKNNRRGYSLPRNTTVMDFNAARDIKKGELLTFRSDMREAIDQLILGGTHSNDHFSEGVQLWVEWDQDNSARLNALNCSEARISSGGSWTPHLMKCAQLQVLDKSVPRYNEAGENIGDITRDNYNFDVQEIELAAFDFLNSQVSLVLDNIPNPESHPQCFDTPILSPFGRQIALHNNKLLSMFITFRERLARGKEVHQKV